MMIIAARLDMMIDARWKIRTNLSK